MVIDILVQISSGQGPQECQCAVGLLLQALEKEFPDINVIARNPGSGKGCYTSVMFETENDLSALEGSVLWVCKSPYRPNHGRKNWYVDVSIIPEAKTVAKEADYQIERLHSGGHGGQNVNKVKTGVRVRHIPTGITVVCTEERSQYLNKRKAMKRIQEQLGRRKEMAAAQHRNVAWREHNRIVRGNPVRTYQGMKFLRVK